MTNPYDTLGVAKNASADEIKKAYRKLAREHHPDASGGDEARFKEIQGAYDVLSDPEKRQQYDTFGSANGRMGGAGFGGGGAGGGPQFADFDLSDLFGGIFGGGARQRGPVPERGPDVEAHTTLSFDDALRGAEVRVPVEVETACRTCGGTGAEPGTAPTVCPQCGGRGVVSDSQGLFSLSHPCPRCRGNGTVIEHPCATCRGSGRERTTKNFNVKIRPGIKDRARIRDRRQGRGGSQRRSGRRPVRRRPRRAVRRLHPPWRRPDRRRPGRLRRCCARRVGRRPDSRRPDLAEGSRRLAARQAAQGQGPGSPQVGGSRQG